MLVDVYKSAHGVVINYVKCGINFCLTGIQSELPYTGSYVQELYRVCLLCQMRYIFLFNWCTKQAMLAAVYKSCTWCLYFVQCCIFLV